MGTLLQVSAHRPLDPQLLQQRKRRPLDGLDGPAAHRDVARLAGVGHQIVDAAATNIPVILRTENNVQPDTYISQKTPMLPGFSKE